MSRVYINYQGETRDAEVSTIHLYIGPGKNTRGLFGGNKLTFLKRELDIKSTISMMQKSQCCNLKITSAIRYLFSNKILEAIEPKADKPDKMTVTKF